MVGLLYRHLYDHEPKKLTSSRGEFVITGLEDFIGYLYAYMLYEDVPTLFEELFIRPNPPALNPR